ncbi:MAG TPA: tetratricopeptide repeat protein [Sphingomicrobium sp.]|nr:tetratricopeptide repeat protein [Sphingomicrobium sp.]
MNMLRATSGLTALAIAGMIAGCANPSGGFQAKSAKANDANEVGLATRAHLALASGDVQGAIALGERAVEKTPRDATFRLLLGNAYLAGGRFASAEGAYLDAMTLDPTQAPVALKLVLVQIAQGKTGEALAMLDQLRGSVEAADVGLAMALAGQPGNAIALLDEAARRPGADGRTRQNLALAHALAGDWESARTIAAQDVPADQLDARIAGWMEMAKPGQPSTQVASLIGVTPAASDPGLPVRLALTQTGERMAAAAPTPPQPPVAAAAMAEVALAEPVPAPAATTVMNDLSFAVPAASPAPVEMAELAPSGEAAPLPDMAQTLDSLRTEPVRRSSSLPKVAELRRAAAARFGKSKVVVQLGAYGSPKSLQQGWAKLAKRHGTLSRYTPTTARFQAPIGTVYRLSLKGFASDGEARRMCQQLKSSGANCFVRTIAGDTPVRLASL